MGKDNFKKNIYILDFFQSFCRNRRSNKNQNGKYVGWNKVLVYHVFASLPTRCVFTALKPLKLP